MLPATTVCVGLPETPGQEGAAAAGDHAGAGSTVTGGDGRGAGGAGASISRASRAAAASAPAVGKRSFGSLAMPRAITASRAGGMPSTRLLTCGGP